MTPEVTTRTSRFIPAGAGNTDEYSRLLDGCPVYPRWRGEHCCATLPGHSRKGLSPLARGTRLNSEAYSYSLRFIPAGAGNTLRWISAWGQSPVYPRWRGEHSIVFSKASMFKGLSPLARGTLGDWTCRDGGYRFIPAGAGNTTRYAETE